MDGRDPVSVYWPRDFCLLLEWRVKLNITLDSGLRSRHSTSREASPLGPGRNRTEVRDWMLTGKQVSASNRARDALPSPIRKLTPLADRARAEGVHIYHLNIGQPDLLAPTSLMDGIRQYDSLLLPYAPSQGITETIDAWQAYYDQLGIEFERNQLLVTTG